MKDRTVAVLTALVLWITVVIIIYLFVSASSPSANPDPLLKIAIIDTGYDASLAYRTGAVPLKVCKAGSFDFVTNRPGVGAGELPHGTIVGSVIAQELQEVEYCAVIFRAFGQRSVEPPIIAAAMLAANAVPGLKFVNISLVGNLPEPSEKLAAQAVTEAGLELFVAAGNEKTNLDARCASFPGCYGLRGIVMVGALDALGNIAKYSNYGKVVSNWEQGDVLWGSEIERGTSYASPKALGKRAFAYATAHGLLLPQQARSQTLLKPLQLPSTTKSDWTNIRQSLKNK